MQKEDRRTGKKIKKGRNNDLYSDRCLQELFEVFYEAKEAEGRSPSTLQQYQFNISFFMNYLEKKAIKPIMSNITVDVIRKYIVYMRKEVVKYDEHKFKKEASQTVGLSPISINTRLKTLRVLFQFLYSEKYIDHNLMKSVKSIREVDNHIEVLTVQELNQLMKIPNQRDYSGFRDYVLMHVLLDGMTRISETLSLKKGDIDFKSNVWVIQGENAKSRKARIIPLQKKTAQLLKELIKENQDFESDYLFLTNYGERLDRNHFRKRLKSYAEKAGIQKNVHPHLFRHTGATIFLESGGEIRSLQLLLGHADLRMVMKYTHLSNESLIKQHNIYSPLKQLDYMEKKHSRKTKRQT